MNRTDRLYALAEALRSGGRLGRTAAWLARELEVSVRTVKRDVAALLAAGTPVVSQDGRGGGYQLMIDRPLPLQFSAGEAAAIAIALGAQPELPFAADGRAALRKILGAMNAAQRLEVQRVADRVWVRTRGPSWRGSSQACVQLLDEALRRGVAVTIDYLDRDGRRSRSRRIDPLTFARVTSRWYVLAWCHSRRAGRWFRFDRIERVRLTRTPIVERSIEALFGPAPDDAQPISLRLR